MLNDFNISTSSMIIAISSLHEILVNNQYGPLYAKLNDSNVSVSSMIIAIYSLDKILVNSQYGHLCARAYVVYKPKLWEFLLILLVNLIYTQEDLFDHNF